MQTKDRPRYIQIPLTDDLDQALTHLAGLHMRSRAMQALSMFLCGLEFEKAANMKHSNAAQEQAGE